MVWLVLVQPKKANDGQNVTNHWLQCFSKTRAVVEQYFTDTAFKVSQVMQYGRIAQLNSDIQAYKQIYK